MARKRRGRDGFGKPIISTKAYKKLGYTKAVKGTGPWVNNGRVLLIQAYFHPKGRVSASVTYKQEWGGLTMRCDPRKEYWKTRREFKEFCERYRLTLSEVAPLESFKETTWYGGL